MPRRKRTGRQQRLNDRVIAELQKLIQLGIPWRADDKYHANLGIMELYGLVSGSFFLCSLFDEHGDEETKRAVYEAVKQEFVPAHAHYRPGTRPWAWWTWDAPVERPDRDDAGEQTDDENEEQNQYEYLEHLDLLFAEEKAIFAKHDSVIVVTVNFGDLGKCAQCWERAREIAKKINFDLEIAIRRYEFWIPGDLYLKCEHTPWCRNEGIFRERL